jgi:hypothetical protein
MMNYKEPYGNIKVRKINEEQERFFFFFFAQFGTLPFKQGH